jgi:outer membrane protein TolC
VKSIFVIAPFVLAFVIACQGQGQSPAPSLNPATLPITVDQAVAEAMQGNPEIRSASRKLSLSQLKTSTARSLDDPMLMVRDWDTPLRQPWDLNQAQLMVGIQRTLLSKDKRDAKARIAGDDADVAASDVEAVRQEVATEVRKACADLKRNADEMKLHDREGSLLKEALAGALAEYTTGKTPQAEVLKAQMAVTRLNEHLLELEEERDTAAAELNTLLGRQMEEPVEIAGSYADPINPPSIETLEQTAIQNRPELAALRKGITRAIDGSQITRLAMKPDFTVAAGYMLMPSGSYARSAYMAELSMNLPRWNRERHEGEAKQADAATAVTQSELEARTQAVFLEVRRAQIETQVAERRMKLYRDTLLPQAEATFKASTAAYQNNRGGFQALVESQNLLLDIQDAYYNASAAADKGIAELERAIGAPVPATSTQGRGK